MVLSAKERKRQQRERNKKKENENPTFLSWDTKVRHFNYWLKF